VSLEKSWEEQALLDQIDAEQEKLADLEESLRAAIGELQTLASEREKYELLDAVTGSLEQLERLGAADLFWRDTLPGEARSTHLAEVRRQAKAFCDRVAGIEERRDRLARELEERDDVLEYLQAELHDLREEQERKLNEWVPERDASPLPFRRMIMPWTRGVEEDRRFRQSLAATVAASVLVALVLRMIDLPVPEHEELIEVPERVARLIQSEPPPPARTVETEPDPVIEEPPEPEEQVVEQTPPEETPEITEPAKVAEQSAPKQEVRSKGILAFRESFAQRARSGPSADLGASARVGNRGESAVGRPTRAMVTTDAPGSSGGINLASVSRDVGGGAGGQGIEGVRVTQVATSIGGDGSADRPRAGGPSAGRTDEEIQIVFDRYKAALYRLYNRELRRDPTLRGQLVLKLTIEPDGSVSMCRLHSSDMGAPDLADQIVARVSGFDFGAKEDIAAMTIIYPIDFLPATT